jgi:magnesium transporter
VATQQQKRPRFPFPARPGNGRPSHPIAAAPEVSMEARPEDVVEPVAKSIVDAALYRDGRRIEAPTSVAEIAQRLRDEPETVGWIGMFRPSEAQFLPVAEAFGLHELAVEDAIVAHQRPKLERYGDTLFVVLRAATYLDDVEEVEFGEIHVFIGPNFVITVRHSRTPDLSAVRARMEDDPELLAMGPEAVLYAILDSVVDGYAPVVAGVGKDIDEIEIQVFRGDSAVSRRIYELSGEVVEFQRATTPLLAIADRLTAGFDKYGTQEELQRYLRDVADHATIAAERVAGFRQALSDILTLNATLVSQAQNEEIRRLTLTSLEQNEEVKRISAWAAILFAPTLIGTIYGMNFHDMPGLNSDYGFLFSVVLMVVVSASLWVIFRRRGWL